MGRCAVALLVLAGCFAPNPQAGAPCGAMGACPAPLICASNNTCQMTDVDAPHSEAGSDTTPPAQCGPDEAPCTAQCGTDPCFKPAHVTTGFGTFASANVGTVSIGTVALNTANGAIGTVRGPNVDPAQYEVIAGIGFIRRTQPNNAPPIAIWMFGELTIAGRVTATGPAAVLLASARRMNVAAGATIDLAASGLAPGPGGFAGGTFRTAGTGCGGGGAPAGTGTSGDTGSTEGGGGGGGFGTAGGAGGAGGGTAGTGGSIGTCGALLESVLVGGSGGAGGDTSGIVPGPFGGGGGGAIQLTSMGELVVAGTITVGGGAGRTAEGNGRDGAGGGSGGAIFLEAPALSLASSAGLYANGGGGGSASAGTGNACTGPLAENGKPSLVAANGSQCAVGNGGNGAVSTTAAAPGQASGAGGGGGGGLGRIVLRTRPGATPAIATTNLSPPPSSAAFAIRTTLD